MNTARIMRGGRAFEVDLSSPLSLAIPLDFAGAQANHFDAPHAHAHPLRLGAFVGDVRQGGSVNCEQVTLVPHCNGTHTECVGHLTAERVAVNDVLPGGLLLARLISVDPIALAHGPTDTATTSTPDRVVTDTLLEEALARWPGQSEALVVRTLANDENRGITRYSGPAPSAYFTSEAGQFLARQGIDHLIVDLPSIDRSHDAGRMLAHRAFWGLDESETRASLARRPRATITELAWIAPLIPDGWYCLDLQIPPFLTDAAPSRPLLYRARPHD